MTHTEVREMICEAGRRMWEKDLVGATDGNISARLEPGVYLCTPSGMSKGFMKPAHILTADAEGNRIAGKGRVTSEFFTHLAAYEEREDIEAVVHGHPITATALTLAGISMTDPVIPEMLMGLLAVPTTDYATPAGREGSGVVRPWIRDYDAVLLDRHGVLTVGKDVFDAYFKLEKVEHAARTLHAAHCLGKVRRLETDHIGKLMRWRFNAGKDEPREYPFPPDA
jgi:L-fuculose-phosphate aldolase